MLGWDHCDQHQWSEHHQWSEPQRLQSDWRSWRRVSARDSLSWLALLLAELPQESRECKQCSYRRARGQSGESGKRPAFSAMTERAIAMSALHAHEDQAVLIQRDERPIWRVWREASSLSYDREGHSHECTERDDDEQQSLTGRGMPLESDEGQILA